MKKPVMLLLLLLILLLPTMAVAATVLPVCVTPGDAESADSPYAIKLWQTSSKKTYLFLPSDWDTSSLRIWYTEGDALTVDGSTVASGSQVSCLTPGASVKLKYGKKSCTVQVSQSANIATAYLTTESGSMTYIHTSKLNRETGTILLTDANGEVLCDQDLTQIKCRGNTSFRKSPKKSYQIKLTNSQNLFGFGKSKTWLLITGYRDRSFLRNVIAADIASYVGLAYTPSYTFCSVYANGEYCGLYLLTEKVQISSSRVDIDDLEKATEAVNDQPLSSYKQLGSTTAKAGKGKYYAIPNNPDDITGGYLIRLEALKHYKELNSTFVTSRAFQCQIVSPDYVSEAQYDYITAILQSFENAIMASDGIDPDTGKHYSELCDVESFVLKYTLEETVKSYDANHNSQYLYKPADSQSTLLYAGPAWDYDTSWGSYASAGKTWTNESRMAAWFAVK